MKTSVALFLSFENVEIIAKEAIKVYVIDVKITWVSNYSYPITKRSNRTSVIGHPRGADYVTYRRPATNHDLEFCYRYEYIIQTCLGEETLLLIFS